MNNWIPFAVNYQINLRSLAVREPRNAIEAAGEKPLTESPLAYVTKNLATLKELGPSVLHLMPPFPIGLEGRKGIGSPYAVQDYLSINPEFGTMEDFKTFVSTAHREGFKVIIGMVPNHTSRDNVWIKSHPEYFVKNEKGEILYDCDWSDTAKLDYRNPGLRKAMHEVYDFWLGCLGNGEGVDGFRVDMAHFINDLSYWDESLPVLKRKFAPRHLLFLAECYGRENNLDLFKRQFNAAYDDNYYKCLEWFFGVDHNLESCLLPSPSLNEEWLHPLRETFRSHGIAGVVEHTLMPYEEVLPCSPDAPRLARYADNHDEGRGVYRFGSGAVRAAMQLAFLSPHAIPFLLTGQEFGAGNRPSIHERLQPCDKGRRFKGDPQRRQEGVEFEGNLFARTYEERQAWFNFYKNLIRVRRENPALSLGTFGLLHHAEKATGPDRAVVAFERKHEGVTIRCAVNFSAESRPLSHPDEWKGTTILGGLQDGMLGPWSAIVIRA